MTTATTFYLVGFCSEADAECRNDDNSSTEDFAYPQGILCHDPKVGLAGQLEDHIQFLNELNDGEEQFSASDFRWEYAEKTPGIEGCYQLMHRSQSVVGCAVVRKIEVKS